MEHLLSLEREIVYGGDLQKRKSLYSIKIPYALSKCALNQLMTYNSNIYVENLGWDLFG